MSEGWVSRWARRHNMEPTVVEADHPHELPRLNPGEHVLIGYVDGTRVGIRRCGNRYFGGELTPQGEPAEHGRTRSHKYQAFSEARTVLQKVTQSHRNVR